MREQKPFSEKGRVSVRVKVRVKRLRLELRLVERAEKTEPRTKRLRRQSHQDRIIKTEPIKTERRRSSRERRQE
jgi:hypothetical protein